MYPNDTFPVVRVFVCVSGRWKGGRRISIRMALAWLFMLPIIAVEGGWWVGRLGWVFCFQFFPHCFSLFVCWYNVERQRGRRRRVLLAFISLKREAHGWVQRSRKKQHNWLWYKNRMVGWGCGVFYSGLNRGWSDNCTDDQMNVIPELFVGGLTWVLPLCLCFRLDLVTQARQCCWTTFFRFSVSFINQTVTTFNNM